MRAGSAGAPARHDDRRGQLMLRLSRFGDLTTHQSERNASHPFRTKDDDRRQARRRRGLRVWAARTVCAASISTPRLRRWATPPGKECKMQSFDELREE